MYLLRLLVELARQQTDHRGQFLVVQLLELLDLTVELLAAAIEERPRLGLGLRQQIQHHLTLLIEIHLTATLTPLPRRNAIIVLVHRQRKDHAVQQPTAVARRRDHRMHPRLRLLPPRSRIVVRDFQVIADTAPGLVNHVRDQHDITIPRMFGILPHDDTETVLGPDRTKRIEHLIQLGIRRSEMRVLMLRNHPRDLGLALVHGFRP